MTNCVLTSWILNSGVDILYLVVLALRRLYCTCWKRISDFSKIFSKFLPIPNFLRENFPLKKSFATYLCSVLKVWRQDCIKTFNFMEPINMTFPHTSLGCFSQNIRYEDLIRPNYAILSARYFLTKAKEPYNRKKSQIKKQGLFVCFRFLNKVS